MIYFNDKLPTPLLDATGYALCRLWFMAKDGYNVLDVGGYYTDYYVNWVSKTKFIKVNPYKINKGKGEIIRIKDKYYVGDGMGTVIYDPFNGASQELKDYKTGKVAITEKYFKED